MAESHNIILRVKVKIMGANVIKVIRKVTAKLGFRKVGIIGIPSL